MKREILNYEHEKKFLNSILLIFFGILILGVLVVGVCGLENGRNVLIEDGSLAFIKEKIDPVTNEPSKILFYKDENGEEIDTGIDVGRGNEGTISIRNKDGGKGLESLEVTVGKGAFLFSNGVYVSGIEGMTSDARVEFSLDENGKAVPRYFDSRLLMGTFDDKGDFTTSLEINVNGRNGNAQTKGTTIGYVDEFKRDQTAPNIQRDKKTGAVVVRMDGNQKYSVHDWSEQIMNSAFLVLKSDVSEASSVKLYAKNVEVKGYAEEVIQVIQNPSGTRGIGGKSEEAKLDVLIPRTGGTELTAKSEKGVERVGIGISSVFGLAKEVKEKFKKATASTAEVLEQEVVEWLKKPDNPREFDSSFIIESDGKGDYGLKPAKNFPPLPLPIEEIDTSSEAKARALHIDTLTKPYGSGTGGPFTPFENLDFEKHPIVKYSEKGLTERFVIVNYNINNPANPLPFYVNGKAVDYYFAYREGDESRSVIYAAEKNVNGEFKVYKDRMLILSPRASLL